MSKRMKLISEDEYNTLTKFRDRDILLSNEENFTLDKNKSMENILDSNEIPDDIKVNLYSKLLRNVHEDLKKISEKPILVENKSATCFPRSYVRIWRRAELISS